VVFLTLSVELTAPQQINHVDYVSNLDTSRGFVNQPTKDNLLDQRQQQDIHKNDAIVIMATDLIKIYMLVIITLTLVTLPIIMTFIIILRIMLVIIFRMAHIAIPRCIIIIINL